MPMRDGFKQPPNHSGIDDWPESSFTSVMRLSVVLLCAICLAGCASRHRSQPAMPGAQAARGTAAPGPAQPNPKMTVTPGRATNGRIAAVNPAGHFVVLTFPLGTMPALEKRLNVYREGLKVGELKVTGPQLDINIDADITAGECRVGDEVRED